MAMEKLNYGWKLSVVDVVNRQHDGEYDNEHFWSYSITSVDGNWVQPVFKEPETVRIKILRAECF
jgi:hypothetical protein